MGALGSRLMTCRKKPDVFSDVPRESMGLIYLPTHLSKKINHSACRQIYSSSMDLMGYVKACEQ